MKPSSGTWFHSLHATSQALQPMQTVGSVKKPTSTFSCTKLWWRWFVLCSPSPIMAYARASCCGLGSVGASRAVRDAIAGKNSCSFFSFCGVTPAAGLCTEWFFGMQNRRACLWGVFIEKVGERASARQTARHNVTSARLGFHDRDIRFAGNGEKIIGGAAAHQAGCPVMIRQRDLVHALSIHAQHSNPATNKRPRFNGRA